MPEAPGATIDSTAEEMPPDQQPEPASAPVGAELAALAPQAGAYLQAAEPRDILVKAQQIAAPLKELIESAGLAANMGGGKKHVEVGGWQAAGTMLGALGGQPLHAETIWARRMTGEDGNLQRTRYTAKVTKYFKKADGGGVREVVEFDVDGFDWEACVEVRTPSGVVVGRAEAMCARSEATWATRDDQALRSMAETRAESRAFRRAIGWIIHLAGYSPTPKEEMPPENAAAELPAWALEASQDRKKLAHASVAFLLADLKGNAPAGATEVLKGIREAVGAPMPEVLAVALSRVAKAVQGAQAGSMSRAAETEGEASPGSPSAPPEQAATFDPVTQTAEPARPPAGSVDAELTVEMTAEQQEAQLRDRGRICDNPLSEVKFANDSCPIKGNGIPF